MRVSKDEYYMGIAKAVSARATCKRRKYGAVLVKDDIIVATGYNGSARGAVNCCDRGICARQAQDIPHGMRYEECVAIHAEDNAITAAGIQNAMGATLYLYGEEDGKAIAAMPCKMCGRKIVNVGIKRLVTSKGAV